MKELKLRLGKWILYAPVAALPLLAALVQGQPSAPPTFQGNFVWLLTALGLGIWFGWATSGEASDRDG